MLPEGKVKLVDFPTRNADFRAIQLYLDEIPYLVCGDSNKLHAFLLHDFLQKNGITFDTIPSPRAPPARIPALSDDNRYRVVGMGYAEIYYDIHYFQLPYDGSRDYKIGPDKEFNQMLKEMFEGWNF